MRKILSFMGLIYCVFSLNGCDERNSVTSADNPASQSTGTESFNSCAKNTGFPESRVFLENIGISPDGFENYPEGVKCFTENAAMCEHFAGEEGYDEPRQKEILQALSKYCTDAQKALPALKTKYSADAAISKVLTACNEEMSTACSSFRK